VHRRQRQMCIRDSPFLWLRSLPSEERVRKGTLVPIFVVNSASKCVKPQRLTNVNKRQRERYKWRMYHIIEVWATRQQAS
uniref:hypothetical protein n=1 Tax=Ralstonia pseudosolanacearum TaxID=1310165 RepID=UPI001FFA64D7